MKKKRSITVLVCALAASVLMTQAVLADEWDLASGSIQINADENGQTVTQGGSQANDNAPVIIQRGDDYTTNTITVETKNGVSAQFTISGINIETDGNGIDIQGDSAAEITLSGDNSITSYGEAAVHVSEGSLTLKGDGSLDAFSDNYSAGIGSNEDEELSGSVTITDKAKVKAASKGDGAGIGSGDGGEMSGSVTISGEAVVEAESREGAGIGSGDESPGKMSGSIDITGSATVRARSRRDGAGIGSGESSDMSGSITIGGSAKVTAIGSDEEGIGIGAGEYGDMTGSITITDNANVTAYADDLPDDYDELPSVIGARDKVSGNIKIGKNATVTMYLLDGGNVVDGKPGRFGATEGFTEGSTLEIDTTATINGRRYSSENDVRSELLIGDAENLTILLIDLWNVTYIVGNGTWADGTVKKTEMVANGKSPAQIPAGMTAAAGFEGGSWDSDPNGAVITGDVTFTYTFMPKQQKEEEPHNTPEKKPDAGPTDAPAQKSAAGSDKAAAPKTGDTAVTVPLLAAAGAMAILLLAAVLYMKKKEH